MILIKLGGSIITDKSKPLTASNERIAGLAKAISSIEEPVIIVHGGGSFGHYWSVKYDMHTARRRYDLRGVATVKNSMVRLNLIILDLLLQNGVVPYVVPPSAFMSGSRPVPSRVQEIRAIALAGMTPVTYGDAVWAGRSPADAGKTYILSGDRIMSQMARLLRPSLCIFALSEDGLYTDMISKKLIKIVQSSAAQDILDATTGSPEDAAGGQGAAEMDVTGGMIRKVREASEIAGLGINVAFVNGNHPRRLLQAAAQKRFKGTMFVRDGGNLKKNKAVADFKQGR